MVAAFAFRLLFLGHRTRNQHRRSGGGWNRLAFVWPVRLNRERPRPSQGR
jgi:hypothetical protein